MVHSIFPTLVSKLFDLLWGVPWSKQIHLGCLADTGTCHWPSASVISPPAGHALGTCWAGFGGSAPGCSLGRLQQWLWGTAEVLHLQQALLLSSWVKQQENREPFTKVWPAFQGSPSAQIQKKRNTSWHCLFFLQHSISSLKAALATMNRTGTNYSIKRIVPRWDPAENYRINNSWKPLFIIWDLSCTSLGESEATPSASHQLGPLAQAQSWDCHLTPVTGALGASWARPHGQLARLSPHVRTC